MKHYLSHHAVRIVTLFLLMPFFAMSSDSGSSTAQSNANESHQYIRHPVPKNLDIQKSLDIEYEELMFRSFKRLQLLVEGGPLFPRQATPEWNWPNPERTEAVNKNYRETVMSQAYDRHAMVFPEDRDPFGVVLRRTRALLDYYRKHESLPKSRIDAFAARVDALATEAQKVPPVELTPERFKHYQQLYFVQRTIRQTRRRQTRHSHTPQLERLAEQLAKLKAEHPADARRPLFDRACALRREIVMANPLLRFDKILCMVADPGEGRFIEQGRVRWGWGERLHGGGPVILTNFRTGDHKALGIQEILADARVANGRWKGERLTGTFSGLELSYDAKSFLFAATTDRLRWDIFRYTFESGRLEQLTDSPWDDFDPHELPSGRVVFVSTRRGGLGRCGLPPTALTFTLHGMEPDGSDIVTLSFHETNEWQPAVNHEGMIIYTRWDYLDRSWGAAHHLWHCFPDGRNPRNLHGNYPLPHSGFQEEDTSFEDYHHKQYNITNGRNIRPDAEVGFRPIPGSHRLVATAVGHHEGFSGSLIMVDPLVPDDGVMSQVRRITPEVLFPETEQRGRYGDTERYWGSPWPLSEDFYLCNHLEGLYVLDRFGNREIIYHGADSPFRIRDPFPLRPRPRPPVIPSATWQGRRAGEPEHRRATIKVVNCYKADKPLPPGTKVKWMRIVQVVPYLHTKPDKNRYRGVSIYDDSIGRMPLGVVPVEEDGSVYFEAPVERALYFQLLDERGMAVHSMRSLTYVHPGEQMTCLGCHEARQDAAPPTGRATAFLRKPSKITPEVSSGIIPFNYINLVKKPVFDKKCLACHQKHNAKHSQEKAAANGAKLAPDLTYESIAMPRLVFGLSAEMAYCLRRVASGGSRTTPGRFGAHASGLMHILETAPQHKELQKTLTRDDWRRITLWLDMNANRICWTDSDMAPIQAQLDGQIVPLPIDFDPKNPLSIENDRPLPTSGGQ